MILKYMDSRNETIYYVANARMPTEKAHGIQIAKMCEALGMRASLELIIPSRHNPIKESVYQYYHVKKHFTIKKLWCIDMISRAAWLRSVAFFIEVFSFAASIAFYLRKKDAKIIIYTRDIYTLLFLSKTYKIIYEAHTVPETPNVLYKHLFKKVDRVVVLSKHLQQDMKAKGLEGKSVLVAPDAVDYDTFAITDSQQKCRINTNLPVDKKIVLYTGHLYRWKGVYTLLEAATLLPTYTFVFVGGTGIDQKKFAKAVEEKAITNVLVIGHTLHEYMPRYLKAADVLVLPNSGVSRISSHHTSPMKLFEYMASHVPIVASDLPSLREVLSENNAVFSVPDDHISLVQAITKVIEYPEKARVLAQQAAVDVQHYTWKQRAMNILTYIT